MFNLKSTCISKGQLRFQCIIVDMDEEQSFLVPLSVYKISEDKVKHSL